MCTTMRRDWDDVITLLDSGDRSIIEKYIQRCHDNDELFAIKIYQNDLQYLTDNYEKITNRMIQNDCFMISAAFAKDIEVIDFLIDKFNIDLKYVDPAEDIDCLYLACRQNPNLDVIKYFIEKKKMDSYHVQKNDLLITASTSNNSLEVIKYLTEYCLIDVNYKNESGSSCFIVSCFANSNINIIKYLADRVLNYTNPLIINDNDKYRCLVLVCDYRNLFSKRKMTNADTRITLDILKFLIEECLFDVNLTDEITGNNCLIAACYINDDLQLIKYLVEDCKIDTNYCNKTGNNCLLVACCTNPNIDIIKYLIEECRIDMNHKNEDGSNYLLRACGSNPNIEVIKYLCEISTNVNSIMAMVDNINNDCLLTACRLNNNLEIIKYLIEEMGQPTVTPGRNVCREGFDPNRTNIEGDNCLLVAAMHNPNIQIFEYLNHNRGVDINSIDKYGYNCLHLACFKNYVDFVRYLIKERSMDVNYIPANRIGCLVMACEDNNYDVAKHLVEEFDIKIAQQLPLLDFSKFEHLASLINNYDKLNELLRIGIDCYPFDKMFDLVKNINPLRLKSKLLKKIKIKSPFKLNFVDFCSLVDNLDINLLPPRDIYIPRIVNTYTNNNKANKTNKTNKMHMIDYTKSQDILFKCSGEIYYGDRNIVYDAMLCFKNMKDCANFDDIVILDCDVPKYIVNYYLQSIYYGLDNLDTNLLLSQDIYKFIRFIDQYPTINISIDKLEGLLITYFNDHSMQYNDLMIEIIKRYRLKIMYLDFRMKCLII